MAFAGFGDRKIFPEEAIPLRRLVETRAMTAESPFIFPAEVERIIPFTDVTRARLEKRGMFPKRIRVSPKRIAWRRSEVEAWIADPEGWKNRQHDAVADPVGAELVGAETSEDIRKLL